MFVQFIQKWFVCRSACILELNQKLGLTVVLITHEMQIVKDIANRVAVMQDGRLIEEGSVLEFSQTLNNL